MRRRRPQLVLRWLAGWLEPHLPARNQISITASTFRGDPGMKVPMLVINTPEADR